MQELSFQEIDSVAGGKVAWLALIAMLNELVDGFSDGYKNGSK